MNERETYEFWSKRYRKAFDVGFISFVAMAFVCVVLAGFELFWPAVAVGVVWFCIGGAVSGYVAWKHYRSFVSYRMAWGKSEADAISDYHLKFRE